jgi:hypothetical protein
MLRHMATVELLICSRGTCAAGGGKVGGGCQCIIAGIGNRFYDEAAMTVDVDQFGWAVCLYGLKIVLVGCTYVGLPAAATALCL